MSLIECCRLIRYWNYQSLKVNCSYTPGCSVKHISVLGLLYFFWNTLNLHYLFGFLVTFIRFMFKYYLSHQDPPLTTYLKLQSLLFTPTHFTSVWYILSPPPCTHILLHFFHSTYHDLKYILCIYFVNCLSPPECKLFEGRGEGWDCIYSQCPE
jgi:hypothetical protein